MKEQESPLSLTPSEDKQYDKLTKKLVRIGLTDSDWFMLIFLRTKYLISIGENPDTWNLDSRELSRKFIN